MRRFKPWSAAMLQSVAEGPKPREYVVRVGMATVPWGRAMRERERRRVISEGITSLRVRSRVFGPRQVSDDEAIEIGARHVCTAALLALRKNGHIAIEDGMVRRLK